MSTVGTGDAMFYSEVTFCIWIEDPDVNKAVEEDGFVKDDVMPIGMPNKIA